MGGEKNTNTMDGWLSVQNQDIQPGLSFSKNHCEILSFITFCAWFKKISSLSVMAMKYILRL